MRGFLAGSIAVALGATPAMATTISDPAGDFLNSYRGKGNAALEDPSLDIVSATAGYDGVNFLLSATGNGPIGLAGSLFVFGVDRGGGSARLALDGPGVDSSKILWDAVAILFPDGTGRVVVFPAGGPPTIVTLPGAVTVSGNTISGSFAAALLPPNGASPENYTFTLWSRLRVNPAMDGDSSEIADVAPGASGFRAVPEPASWALMLAGFAAVGGVMRARRGVRVGPVPKAV